PRGREALEARQIQQTWPMELITNGIVDQLTGGEVAFESEDEEVSDAEAALQDAIRDVITGPHLMDDDLDDLIAAAVADMLGPGNGYWQLLPSEDGSLPVVSMVPLDALTVRHNSNRHGYPQDPPYYQASDAFSSDGVGTLGNITPTPLGRGDLAVMRYPGARRSYQVYPKSPCMQIRDTLVLLANSTTHHNRFYNDDEIPAGVIQVMNANDSTITDLQDKIQAAAGDPRSVEVIGGEGAAQWIEMGGTAINLDVIQEQQWFLQLCLAAVGLGKAEIGMIEDVNRANGEGEQSRVFKRVTGPFAKQFNAAFQHICEQFDVYNELDQPFKPKLRFSDPREERAREERLREMFQAGGLTRRQYARRRGDEDLADDDMTVEINGETIDYGDLPKDVLEHKLAAVRGETVNEDDVGDQSGTDE
ncbi:phage portal protein, partial [Natrialba taiwanensis]